MDSRLPPEREYNLDKFETQCLEVFDAYPSEKLDNIFDSKQRICKAILDAEPPGGNDYKMPHRRDEK